MMFQGLQTTQLTPKSRNEPTYSQRVEALININESRWFGIGDVSSLLKSELQSRNLPLISPGHSAPIPTSIEGKLVGWTYTSYLDYTTGHHHIALILGDTKRQDLSSSSLPIRIHSASILNESLQGRTARSPEKVSDEMIRITREGRGGIIYMEHNGRGHGIHGNLLSLNQRFVFGPGGIILSQSHEPDSKRSVGLAESYILAGLQNDNRDFAVAAEILKSNGISKVTLRTHSAVKACQLSAAGISVTNEGEKLMFSQIPSRLNNPQLPDAFVEAWIKQLDQHALTPWKTIESNKALLLEAGAPLIRLLNKAPVPTTFGGWTMIAFGDYTSGDVHYAMVYGDYDNKSLGDGNNVLVRVHSSCKTNEVFHSTNCECQAELQQSMKAMEAEGRGVLIYTEQEGRGTGILGKIVQLNNMFDFDSNGRQVLPRLDENGRPIQTVAAYEMSGLPSEMRDFTTAAEIAKHIGLKSIRMMSNNPRKAKFFEEAGIKVNLVGCLVDISQLADPEMLKRELEDKRDGLGHIIPTLDQVSFSNPFL